MIKTGLRAPLNVGAFRAFVRARDSLNLTGVWTYAEFMVATNGYYINIDSQWERVSTEDAAAGGLEPSRFGAVRVTFRP